MTTTIEHSGWGTVPAVAAPLLLVSWPLSHLASRFLAYVPWQVSDGEEAIQKEQQGKIGCLGRYNCRGVLVMVLGRSTCTIGSRPVALRCGTLMTHTGCMLRPQLRPRRFDGVMVATGDCSLMYRLRSRW